MIIIYRHHSNILAWLTHEKLREQNMWYPWEGRTDIKSNRQEGRKDQKEDMIFAVVITIKARKNCKLTWNKFWNSTRAWAQIPLKPEIFFRLINILQLSLKLLLKLGQLYPHFNLISAVHTIFISWWKIITTILQ